MKCPKCSSKKHVKSGFTNGKPRKKCKDCGCNFTRSEAKGKPQILKKIAVILYLEGLGFRSIGRVLGVSNVAVLNWIKQVGKTVEKLRKEQKQINGLQTMQFDEMWHYVGKKNKNFGFGLSSMKLVRNQLILSYDVVE